VTEAEVAQALQSLQLDSYELDVVIPTRSSLAFKVRVGGCEETVVGVNGAQEEVYVDRTKSGIHDFHEQFRGVHKAKLQDTSESIDLKVYVDRSSVEVFANGGQAVITDLIYPKVDSKGISVVTHDDQLVLASLTIYEIAPSSNILNGVSEN
jgi:fructan beta-fructosidase